MATFERSDDESIAQLRAALELVPAQQVGDKFKAGWRPLSPMIAMVPPEYLDDEMRALVTAAAALEQ